MLKAARFVTTTVVSAAVTLTALGCAGDSIVAPTSASQHERTPFASVPFDSASWSTVAIVPGTRSTVTVAKDSTALPTYLPGNTGRVGATRTARAQSLGFRNDQPTANCVDEGAMIGVWRLRFSGYGCTAVTADANGTALSMQPAAAVGSAETHAPLLLGPAYGTHITLNARLETEQQLRTNAPPNAWEVAWLVWNYQDDDHFYYFIPKPNGWELGKRDPAYPGGQRFLATGTDITFPVGRAYDVQVVSRGNLVAITVNGRAIVSFSDSERPYLSGRVALYSEDARIRVHQVSVLQGAD